MTDPRWRLDGQTALITGGSAGIGLAVARELLGLGADVLLAARDAQTLGDVEDDLAEEFPERRLLALAADVKRTPQRYQSALAGRYLTLLFEKLVNNAGTNASRAAMDYAEEEWRGIFETNLFAAFEICRYAHPLLSRHPASAIVNVGSVSGLTHVRTGAPYGASKAALNSMSQSLAKYLAPYNISVGVVAPGFVETEMAREALTGQSGIEIRSQSPFNRVARPQEVAYAVLFLASEGAEFMTGAIIDVNGASYLRT